MEAKELRIGNLVLDDYSGRMIVSAINPYDGMYNHESGVYLCKNNNLPSGYYFLKDIRPIELTEDWLIMFGFEKETALFRKDKHAINLTIAGLYEFKNIPIKEVSYVHELQNLYFAITGKELILNQ